MEISEKNRKFALRYQLSQYFAMGKYINPFTDWGFKRLFGLWQMDLCIKAYGSIRENAVTAQKKIFKRLAELADFRCLSQEEQEKYDESLKAADDYYGVLMSYWMVWMMSLSWNSRA